MLLAQINSKIKMFSIFIGLAYTLIAYSHDKAHHSDKAVFEQDQYLKQCGGEIYNNCDDLNGVNQLSIFEEALAVAANTKRDLIVILGADWCGACKDFEDSMKANETWKEKFDKYFVLVKINLDIASQLQKYHIAAPVIPTTYVYNVTKRRPVYSSIGAPWDINIWVEELLENRNGKVYTAEDFNNISGVSMELLNRPIAIQNGVGNGNTPILISIDSKNQKEKVQMYFNQGISFLHGFHWVDAYRSFKTANDLAESGPAQTGMAMALMEISEGKSDEGYALAAETLKNAQKTFFKNGFQLFELVLFRAVLSDLCSARVQFCDDSLLESIEGIENSWQKLIYLKGVPADLIAISSFKLGSQSGLEKALSIDSENAGAHHYIGHLYEGSDDHVNSLKHLKKFAELVPNIAHAQHMYAHVLPLHGKWEEAITQFEKAHQIHMKWFDENKAKIDEDWHFFHNTDLYTSTLMVMGQYKKATQLLSFTCDREENYDIASCLKASQLYVLSGQFEKAVTSLSNKFGDELTSPVQSVIELQKEILKGNRESANNLFNINKESENIFLQYYFSNDLIELALMGEQEGKLLDYIDSQLGDIMNKGGFDGWSYLAIPFLLSADGLKALGYEKSSEKIKNLILFGSQKMKEHVEKVGKYCEGTSPICSGHKNLSKH